MYLGHVQSPQGPLQGQSHHSEDQTHQRQEQAQVADRVHYLQSIIVKHSLPFVHYKLSSTLKGSEGLKSEIKNCVSLM